MVSDARTNVGKHDTTITIQYTFILPITTKMKIYNKVKLLFDLDFLMLF